MISCGGLATRPGRRYEHLQGKIGLPEDILQNRRTPLSVLFLCCTFAHAQTVAFELQTHLDSPVALVSLTSSTFRTESDRRQFLTVKNESDKVTTALVFQQTIGSGSKTEIVALERVSVIIRPGEKKRLSVSVRDVWNQHQTAVKAGETIGNPILSVVVVEFLDGSAWSTPPGRAHE